MLKGLLNLIPYSIHIFTGCKDKNVGWSVGLQIFSQDRLVENMESREIAVKKDN